MNMKRIITLALAAACIASITEAQTSIGRVLNTIEYNNTSLKALRQDAEAQKIAGKTGIYLANPEVEVAYLWGDPKEIGPRKNLSVTQTFDIATISGMKNKAANGKNELIELQYRSDRQAILLNAKQTCIDIVYYNAMANVLEDRLKKAEALAKAYRGHMEAGDANIIEYNKIKLNLSTVKGDIANLNTERNVALNQLKQLNGGIDIMLGDTAYLTAPLPGNFEEWYSQAETKSPILSYVRRQIETNRNDVKLNKAQNLPNFSLGYTSEITPGQALRGISFGISVPLWENKNKVKLAKASVAAAEAKQAETKQAFYNNLQTLYSKAKGLENTARLYNKALKELDNSELLLKALNAGEISMLDYIVEMQLYYDTIDRAHTAMRDFEKAKSELYAVEL